MSSRRTRVGIIGGGQLGLMLAEALARVRAEVSVYDPDPAAPARRACASFTCAPFSDADLLASFCARQDAMTYEFESIDAEALRLASQRAGTLVLPGVNVLETTRSRFAERAFLKEHGLPCAPYACVTDPNEIDAAIAQVGLPCVVKTDRGGYDGKGQWVLNDAEAFQSARSELAAHLTRPQSGADRGALPQQGLLIEKKVRLQAEASCIVVRQKGSSAAATTRVFPVMENEHRNQILYRTQVPASFDLSVCKHLQTLAGRCAEAFDLHGLLTIEFFIGDPANAEPHLLKRPGSPAALHTDGTHSSPAVYINEFAPRPHNSGHITRRCTNISQFDALAYLLTGLPLPDIRQIPTPAGDHFEMINVLGADTEQPHAPWSDWPQKWSTDSSVTEIYDYGKTEPRPARKMGHVLRFVSSSGEIREPEASP